MLPASGGVRPRWSEASSAKASGRTADLDRTPRLRVHFDRPGAAENLERAVAAHKARQHIDLRRADEAGDFERRRLIVDLLRWRDLQQPPAHHHRDAVGHGHGFRLVVGDVDEGRAQPAMQVGDLGACMHAQLGVEVRQRFVHQERLRMAHHGAAERHALALAAGQLPRSALQQLRDAQHARDRIGLVRDRAASCGGARQDTPDERQPLPRIHAPHHQGQRNVFGDGHVGIKCVALEHHGDVARLRRQVIDRALADHHLALVVLLEAGNDAQQRALAASRGADQRQELAVGNVKRNAMQDLRVAKRLSYLAQPNRCHRPVSFGRR